MARKIIAGFGLFVMIMGIPILIWPNTLPGYMERFLTPGGLGVAAGLRIILGVLLWMAAVSSRTPRTFKVLGVLFVIGGLAIPVLGLERISAMVDWGVSQGDLFLRFDGLIAIGLGGFLAWSAMPPKGAE